MVLQDQAANVQLTKPISGTIFEHFKHWDREFTTIKEKIIDCLSTYRPDEVSEQAVREAKQLMANKIISTANRWSFYIMVGQLGTFLWTWREIFNAKKLNENSSEFQAIQQEIDRLRNSCTEHTRTTQTRDGQNLSETVTRVATNYSQTQSSIETSLHRVNRVIQRVVLHGHIQIFELILNLLMTAKTFTQWKTVVQSTSFRTSIVARIIMACFIALCGMNGWTYYRTRKVLNQLREYLKRMEAVKNDAEKIHRSNQ